MNKPQYRPRITEWPKDERPRERLIENGPDGLSEAELLAIILRTGQSDFTAVDLARLLLQKYGGLRGLDAQSAASLSQTKGIGLAKAAQIKAALELAKRFAQQKSAMRKKIQCSEDIYRFMYLRMRDLGREEFGVIFLSARNEIITHKILFEGSLTESIVSPREIIHYTLELSAASIIMIHNHPSGDPEPSNEDKTITTKIFQACKYCDITVLDHIIIGKDSYFSFADHNMIRQDF
jgi:DNA repair protein RadC